MSADDGIPGPQAGPQTTFADSEADIAILGGGAGGGKSWSLLFEAVKWAAGVNGLWCLPDGMRVVLFRRTAPELIGGGGLWDESQSIYRPLGGRPRASPSLDWVFPGIEGTGDARIEFRHLQRDDDVYGHHGRQYTIVGFDELQHFTARQFWYLLSRLRSAACGVKPYLRATCNPDPDSFVAELVAWWIGEDGYAIPDRSGVLRWLVRVDERMHWYDSAEEAREAHPDRDPLSVTFILARLADNAALSDADPTYRGKLASLSRVDRLRLLGDGERGGNWLARASAGLVFRRSDLRVSDRPPSAPVYAVRAWDKGATAPGTRNRDPDWTRGVRVWLCAGGEWWIDDMVSLRAGPAAVDSAMRAAAESDGVEVTVAVWQDAAQAGIVDVEHTRDVLHGYALEVVRADEGVVRGYGGRAKWTHAKVWAPLVERGQVWIRRAEWPIAGADDGRSTSSHETIVAELDAFPDGGHDDIVDALSLAAQVLARARPGGPAVTLSGEPRVTARLYQKRYT